MATSTTMTTSLTTTFSLSPYGGGFPLPEEADLRAEAVAGLACPIIEEGGGKWRSEFLDRALSPSRVLPPPPPRVFVRIKNPYEAPITARGAEECRELLHREPLWSFLSVEVQQSCERYITWFKEGVNSPLCSLCIRIAYMRHQRAHRGKVTEEREGWTGEAWDEVARALCQAPGLARKAFNRRELGKPQDGGLAARLRALGAPEGWNYRDALHCADVALARSAARRRKAEEREVTGKNPAKRLRKTA